MLNTTSSDALSLTINDTTLTSVDDLISLDGKTSVAVDATSVTDVTDEISDLNTAYNSTGIDGLGDENVILTDTGTITASEMNDLLPETSGNITMDGVGSLEITLEVNEALDLSSITNSLDGTLTIADSTGNETITGTGENDIVSLSSGDDTVSLGDGDDTINIKSSDLTSLDTITGEGGSDTLNITTAGTANATNVSVETMNLSDGTNDFTLGNNIGTVNGGTDADTFTLDFTNVTTINTDAGSDTVNLTGSASVATDGDLFTGASNVNGLEVLDLTALNSGSGFNGDDSVEFSFTTSLIEQLVGNSAGDLTIKLTSDQAEDIQFTTSDSEVHDTTSNGVHSIADNTTYALDADTNILIDII